MKHEHRIPAKILSFLLAVVMLVGCITVGFTALAVEDSYQVLADALRADGMAGLVPTYKVSASPDVKNAISANDPRATSAVYVKSTAMWNAMDAFWSVAAAARVNDVGNITVDDKGNVASGWTGENNTARKIANAVLDKLISGGYMTNAEIAQLDVLGTFNWFIGNFTAEHALMDEPVRSEKAPLLPWTHQIFASTGYFGVTRSREDALLAGTKNYKLIPDTLELNKRWEWKHDARYAKNAAGDFRQYWHVLNSMSVKSNVVGAVGLGFDPAEANTVGLKTALTKWDAAFKESYLKQDLSGKSEQQLNEMKTAVEAIIAEAKSQDVTNRLLYYYGLATYLDVSVLQKNIEENLKLAPYRPYVDYFNDPLTKGQLSRLDKNEALAEAKKARLNLDVLKGISTSNSELYNGLITVNGLDLVAAEDYFDTIIQSLGSGDRDYYLIGIAQYIKDYLDYVPASTMPLVQEHYELKNTAPASTATATDLLAIYEFLVAGNGALTGDIGGVPNFVYPAGSSNFNIIEALKNSPVPAGDRINLPSGSNPVPLAIGAIKSAISDKDPTVFYDYIKEHNDSNKPSFIAGDYNDNYDAYAGMPAAPAAFERYPDSFDALTKPATPYFEDPSTWVVVDPLLWADANEAEAAINALTPGQKALAPDEMALLPATGPADAGYQAAAQAVIDKINSLAPHATEAANYAATLAWVNAYNGYATPPALPGTPPSRSAFTDDVDVNGNVTLSAQSKYAAAAETYINSVIAVPGLTSFFVAMAGPAAPIRSAFPDDGAYSTATVDYFIFISTLNLAANTAFTSLTTLKDKYDYLINLPVRLAAAKTAQDAVDTALADPINAYNYMVFLQKAYETALAGGDQQAIYTARSNFMAAAAHYHSLTKTLGAAYEIPGYTAEVAAFAALSSDINMISMFGSFYNPYRLSVQGDLQPTDWDIYSVAQLQTEFNNAKAKNAELIAYKANHLPEDWDAYTPAEKQAWEDAWEAKYGTWLDYFGRTNDNDAYTPGTDETVNSLQDAIRDRLLELLNVINTDIPEQDYVDAMDPNSTGIFSFPFGLPYPLYDISAIGLLALIETTDYGVLTAAEIAKIAYARRILGMFRGLIFDYETLHWDLISGAENPFMDQVDTWYPIREVNEDASIVLTYGEDEFVVKYEHIENLINKLDTLVSSELINQLAPALGLDPTSMFAPAAEETTTQALTSLTNPVFHVPNLEGFDLMRLGEMRYSSKGLTITNTYSGIEINLPPLKTMRDTDRIVDAAAQIKAERKWIQAYRADVLLYLLHYLFSAVNTADQDGDGLEMLSWLVKTLLGNSSTSVNNQPASQYASTLQSPGNIAGDAGAAITQALQAKLDLSAAAKPFLTQMLQGLVAKNLYSDMLPNTVIGLYKMLSDLVWPFLADPLIKDGSGKGLIDDSELFMGIKLSGVFSALGITSVNSILNSDMFKELFGFIGVSSVTSLLELLLGAEITPKDMVTKCWPDIWPTVSGGVPVPPANANAPDYAKPGGAMYDNLVAIYTFLNTPGNFEGPSEDGQYYNSGTNNNVDSWLAISTDDISTIFKWGIEDLAPDPALTDSAAIENALSAQRTAFTDVMAFSMSGLAFVLSAIFSDTGLGIKFMDDKAIDKGRVDEPWYFDIIIKMGWLEDIINAIIGWIPFVPDVSIPDIVFSKLFPNLLHWRGVYDSRTGLYANLSSVNAYGKLMIPLFEMLNIDPILFGKYKQIHTSLTPVSGGYDGEEFSEKNLNAIMGVLGADIADVVRGINGINAANEDYVGNFKTVDTSIDVLYEIAHILVQSLIDPLLNWIAPDMSTPEGKALVPYSIGFRPVGKVLDLLPNLAFLVEKKIIPQTVNDTLGGLELKAQLCLGGFSGNQLKNLFQALNLPDLLQDLIGNMVGQAIGGTLGSVLGWITGGLAKVIGWVLDALLAPLAGGIIDLFKDQNYPHKSTLGMLLGIFGGESLASKLTFDLADMKVMDLLSKMLLKDHNSTTECPDHDNKIHTPDIFGYLHHMIGIDLTSDLDGLIQGAIGMLGIGDTDPTATIPVLSADPATNMALLGLIDKVISKESHLEGFLIELFNPQTYPNKSFMIYAMVEQAKTAQQLNEVNYSEVWTEEKANFLNNNLMTFLNNLWDFLFAQEFLPWLWALLKEQLGLDITNLYTAENLSAILEMLSGLLSGLDIDSLLGSEMIQKLLPFIGDAQSLLDVDSLLFTVNVLKYFSDPTGASAEVAAEIARIKSLSVNSREDFTDVLFSLLAPLAPILKIFLTGGRTTDAKGKLIETIWYGELYPNNMARDIGYFTPGDMDSHDKNYVYNRARYVKVNAPYAVAEDNYTYGAVKPNAWEGGKTNVIAYDPNATFYTIGAEGDNLTLLEDYLGFSGYDGYRQALIPIFEHLGVPKEDIPNFQMFVERATNKYDTSGAKTYDGDAVFFEMLITPLLNLVDRVVDDPLGTVFDILPNLLYFITAEPTAQDLAAHPEIMRGTTNLNECLNRLLRPIYAIVDMIQPLASIDEIVGMLPLFGINLDEEMLTNGGLPLNLSVSDDISIPIDIPIEISLNKIVSGLLGGMDIMGMQIDLTDLTSLISGQLEIYKSQNGQNDAVRLKGDLPSLLTNLIRQLLTLVFTPENFPVLEGMLADIGIPAALQPVVDQLLKNIYGLMSDHTLQGNIGADLVLSMLFYIFYDADALVNELLTMRDVYRVRIVNMFEIVANSSSPQLRRYAERARRFLNLFYGDIIEPDQPTVQKSGFIAFITKFFDKVSNFFTSLGDWFMRLIRWLFPYFF